MDEPSPPDRSGLCDWLVVAETREVSRGSHRVGFRTRAAQFDNLSEDRRECRVAEEFLVAGRNQRYDRAGQLSVAHYFTDPIVNVLSRSGADATRVAERVDLGESAVARSRFSDVVARRRSIRSFSGAGLSLPELAYLLRCGDSETAEADAVLSSGGTVPLRLRTAPSGGGLYPVEIWVAVRAVRGVTPGVYRYRPRADDLEKQFPDRAVTALLASCMDDAGGIDTASCAVMFLLVVKPWRAMRKYGPRGMRFVFQEVGAISQNVHLAATALGIGSTDYSSFYDDEAHEALDLDGNFRSVAHMVLAGPVD